MRTAPRLGAAATFVALAATWLWLDASWLRADEALPSSFASDAEVISRLRAELHSHGPCFACGAESRPMRLLDALGELQGPYALGDFALPLEERCAALENFTALPTPTFGACEPASEVVQRLSVADGEATVEVSAQEPVDIEFFGVPACNARRCGQARATSTSPDWPVRDVRVRDYDGRSAFAWDPLAGVRDYRGRVARLTKRPPNIVVVVMDSVSLCHFERLCPQLARLVQAGGQGDVRAVLFEQFHTMHALNTLYQMGATMTGLRLPESTELFNEALVCDWAARFDRRRWLWNELRADAGYLTAMASGYALGSWRGDSSDCNLLGDFDVVVPGAERDIPASREAPQCLDGQWAPRFRLQRLRELLRASELPVFAWEQSFYAHDDKGHANAAVFDAAYADELLALAREEDNTVVVLMGDHGPSTSVLHNWPLLSLLGTDAALAAAGVSLDALRSNADRLVTHFDLHATLRGLAGLPSQSQPLADSGAQFLPPMRAFQPRPLWEPRPRERSLAQAGVPASTAVMDGRPRALPPDTARVRYIVETALVEKNWMLLLKLQCPRLEFGRVRRAQRYQLGSIAFYLIEFKVKGLEFWYAVRSAWLVGSPSSADSLVSVEMRAITTYDPNRKCSDAKVEFCLCSDSFWAGG